MKIFKLTWKLTDEAVDNLEQMLYVESDSGVELVKKFSELYQKYLDLMHALIVNVEEKAYLETKGIEQEELASDIKDLKEVVERYLEETDSGFQNIDTEQSDMDIMWCYLNAIISDKLLVRGLLGEMLVEYMPELVSYSYIGECADSTLDVEGINALYVTRMK